MKDVTERQAMLLALLQEHGEPLPGQTLAERLGVTRQIVVRDIALLRALGKRIMATPKGYLVQGDSSRKQGLLAVSHAFEQTEAELNTLVDCGVKVLDVRVEHAVYGEIVANLFLASRRDVEHFMRKIASEQAPLLSSLTGGSHYHLVEYDHEDEFHDATRKLSAMGIEVFE